MNSRDGSTPELTDVDVEGEIQRKGLVAPRVTPERLMEVIKSEEYHVFEESLS